MTNGQVLVHVEPGKVSEARLRYAITLAQYLEMKLVGLAVRLSAGAAVSTAVTDVHAIAALCEASEECCKSAQEQFSTLTSCSGLERDWIEATGVPRNVIAAEAGRADLVVLGRSGSSDEDGGVYAVAPADIILACGSPALVVPDEPTSAFRGKRILIAWKGSPQAARAVKDALPLLSRAEAVIVTEIIAEEGPYTYQVSAQAMAAFLATHGIDVRVEPITAAGDTGAQILLAAADHECDLIVAGAYGHSRLREWALGGVTRTLLGEDAPPCLLSH